MISEEDRLDWLENHKEIPMSKVDDGGPTVEFDTRPYITTYRAGGGWNAVHVWFTPDMGGFWEPMQTGFGPYATEEEAIAEAKSWSESDEIRYVARKPEGRP